MLNPTTRPRLAGGWRAACHVGVRHRNCVGVESSRVPHALPSVRHLCSCAARLRFTSCMAGRGSRVAERRSGGCLNVYGSRSTFGWPARRASALQRCACRVVARGGWGWGGVCRCFRCRWTFASLRDVAWGVRSGGGIPGPRPPVRGVWTPLGFVPTYLPTYLELS